MAPHLSCREAQRAVEFKVDRYREFIDQQVPELKDLWKLQIDSSRLIRNSSSYFDMMDDFQLVSFLYKRPVNSLGQVPNSGRYWWHSSICKNSCWQS